MSIDLNEPVLYADYGAAEIAKEFKFRTISLGIDNIGSDKASDLTGAVIDGNGVVVSTSEESGTPVAVNFHV